MGGLTAASSIEMYGKVVVIFIFCCIGISLQAEAQRFMILQKGANQKSRLKYEEGDQIRYKQKGQDYFISDIIQEVQRDFLVLKENILRPEDITAVDIRNKDERNRTIGNLSGLMFAGGALLFTAETINGLYHEGKLTYSKAGLFFGGSLFASGFILSKLKYKYFRQQGRNKIQIIYLEEESPDKGN